MKDKLGRKIVTELVGLRPKKYSYLIYDDSGNKKVKGTKKWLIKQRLSFKDHKCLQSN